MPVVQKQNKTENKENKPKQSPTNCSNNSLFQCKEEKSPVIARRPCWEETFPPSPRREGLSGCRTKLSSHGRFPTNNTGSPHPTGGWGWTPAPQKGSARRCTALGCSYTCSAHLISRGGTQATPSPTPHRFTPPAFHTPRPVPPAGTKWGLLKVTVTKPPQSSPPAPTPQNAARRGDRSGSGRGCPAAGGDYFPALL